MHWARGVLPTGPPEKSLSKAVIKEKIIERGERVLDTGEGRTEKAMIESLNSIPKARETLKDFKQA